MELAALSDVYQCRYVIHAADKKNIEIDANECKENNVAAKTYHLSYHYGEHYNALVDFEEPEEKKRIKQAIRKNSFETAILSTPAMILCLAFCVILV